MVIISRIRLSLVTAHANTNQYDCSHDHSNPWCSHEYEIIALRYKKCKQCSTVNSMLKGCMYSVMLTWPLNIALADGYRNLSHCIHVTTTGFYANSHQSHLLWRMVSTDHAFILCSLPWECERRDSSGSVLRYLISLCRPLNVSSVDCGNSSAVCLISNGTATSIGNAVGEFDNNIVTEDPTTREFTLQLNGSQCGAETHVTFIIFKCGKTLVCASDMIHCMNIVIVCIGLYSMIYLYSWCLEIFKINDNQLGTIKFEEKNWWSSFPGSSEQLFTGNNIMPINHVHVWNELNSRWY